MKAHKNSWYKEWHQWRLAHHFHVAMLAFYIVSVLLGSLVAFIPGKNVLAATQDWTFDENPPSSYYSYGADVTIGGGMASLGNHTPSTDWIATDVNNWINRRAVTITNPNGSSAFQVKLSGLDTQQGGKMHYDGTDCEDLRFTSSDGATVIPHWVESTSCNSASTDVWVKVPQSVATIYMYYNNSNEALTSTSSDTAVFEKVISNAQGAWQLDEAGSGSGVSIIDVSNNTNTGTTTGTNATAGKFNGARSFDGIDDKVTVTDTNNSLDTTDQLTLSAWIYPTMLPNGTTKFVLDIVNKSYSSNPGEVNYWFYVTSTGTLKFLFRNPSNTSYSYPANTVLTPNAWTHVAVTVQTTSNQVSGTFYVNGVPDGTFTGPADKPMLSNDKDFNIGYSQWYGNYGDFPGNIDDVIVYNSSLSEAEITALADPTNKNHYGYFSPTLHPNIEYVREYTANVSAGAAGSEDGYYHNDNPTIQNEVGGNGLSYSYISAMSITTGGTGSVRFQITPDNGITWYKWNGSAWATIASPDTYDFNKTNSGSEITTNISSFRPGGANPKNFRWRAFFVSDGTQSATIEDVSITYVADTFAPDNPVIGGVTVYESDGGAVWAYDAGQLWHNYSAPKFAWTPPSDNPNPPAGGEDPSGIWRYYAKLTTDAGYTPTSADATTNNYLVASGLVNGQTYYLRVRTVDNAENVSAASTLLTYKYDNVAPTDPSNLQANTLQPTDQPLTFNWTASTDVGNPGEISEFDHYEYKKGTISDWVSTGNTWIGGITGDEDGNNTFRVRAVDKAGNTSSEDTVVYNYTLNAPSEPLNVRVDDQQKEVNNFTFTWEVPSYVKPGNAIAGYKVFVNEIPSASPQNDYSYIDATNKNDLGNVLTKADIRATKQGTNRFYVVAYDNDDPSRINYSKYGWADFNVTTAPPSIPNNVVISDVSDRHNPDHYALALSWKVPDAIPGVTVDHYNIRQTTTPDLTEQQWIDLKPVGTTSSPAYAEANLTKDQMYYYRISALDNAGAESSLTTAVSKAPTGKYIVPPTDSVPVVSVTATTATVTWTTDRVSYSKVEYGKTGSYGMQNSSLQTTMYHSVTLYGLEPGTAYHYRTQSLDSADQEDYNDSDAYSGDLTFITQPAPGISDVKISDIRLDGAIISWKTTSSTISTLKYGKSNTYGKELSDSSGSAVTTHTVKLSGLDHSSTYHFKIFGTDTDGNVMQSDDYNFDTLTFPKITSVNFQQMKGTATSTLKVTWESNVPISSVVQYTDPTGKTMEAAQSELISKHELIVSGLKDNTEYTISVKGRDAYGNEGNSGSEKVKTDFDTRPPNISEITTETSMNGYGTNAKSQMIVSWYTDEPATSQVEYSKGVAGDSFTMASKEDAMLTTSHVVVVSDLDPSSSYYFRVVSKDNSKNEAKSEANSALTEQARSSIFDIVLKSFESTLGWLFGGGK